MDQKQAMSMTKFAFFYLFGNRVNDSKVNVLLLSNTCGKYELIFYNCTSAFLYTNQFKKSVNVTETNKWIISTSYCQDFISSINEHFWIV